MRNLLLDSTVNYCNEKFLKNLDNNICVKELTFSSSSECQECLRKNHFNSESKAYQCPQAILTYVCKYSNKYASEMYLLLEELFKREKIENPKIISFGSGPATEIFALNQCVNDKLINKYQYTGIDNNKNWIDIWDVIQNNVTENENILFMYSTAEEFIENHEFNNNDIILFNYMLSNYATYATKIIVKKFLNNLKEKISGKNVIILFNDINLSFPVDKHKGVTHLLKDCFEPEYIRIFSQFFKNNKNEPEKQFFYENTPMIEKNDLIFECSQDTMDYNPYKSMSAIQMILKKR